MVEDGDEGVIGLVLDRIQHVDEGFVNVRRLVGDDLESAPGGSAAGGGGGLEKGEDDDALLSALENFDGDVLLLEGMRDRDGRHGRTLFD